MPPELIRASELWGPLWALGVFLVMTFVAATVQVVLQVVIKRRKASAPNAIDAQVFATVRGPLVLFLLILGLFLAFTVLADLENGTFDVLKGWDHWARGAWSVVVIAEIAYLVSRLTQVIMAWYVHALASQTSSGVETKLLPPVRRILPVVIYSVAALVILDSLDVSISPLLAGFGIGGIAVALAVQPTLSNFFSGTYLVTEGELRVGDFIELDGGPSGYIEDVGWRSTKIRSRFNNLVIVPNARMADTIVTNYFSPTPAMNVLVSCGVSYDSDLSHVEEVVLEVARQVTADSPHAVKGTVPFFGFSTFGDSNIDFWVFVQATDRIGSFSLTSDLIKGIHARFNEQKIEINYPVRKLLSPTLDNSSPTVHTQDDTV